MWFYRSSMEYLISEGELNNLRISDIVLKIRTLSLCIEIWRD
jgi:hypothetical protein